MKNLIIGSGQIGSALFEVFNPHHDTFIRDVKDMDLLGAQVLHICYPDQDRFIEITKRYADQYKPALTIIHSSVAVGTSERCGPHIVYSPVRGRHPKLKADLRIYDKFIFSETQADLSLAAKFFNECGVRVKPILGKPSIGEMLKLVSNVHMGIEIAWRQQLERMFLDAGIEDSVYREWEESYRHGYIVSNDRDLIRPIMRPDPIGGHCILPCVEILKKQYESKVFDFILESNEEKKGEINGMAEGNITENIIDRNGHDRNGHDRNGVCLNGHAE